MWTWNCFCFDYRTISCSQILQNGWIKIVVHWKFWRKYRSVSYSFSCNQFYAKIFYILNKTCFLLFYFNPPQNVNKCDLNCTINRSISRSISEIVTSTIGFCFSALLFMFGGVSICLCKKVTLLRHGLKNLRNQKAAQYLRENFIWKNPLTTV